MEVKEISKKDAYKIIEACDVINKNMENNYLIKEGDVWSALFINSDNDTFVEEFDNKESAIEWLKAQK